MVPPKPLSTISPLQPQHLDPTLVPKKSSKLVVDNLSVYRFLRTAKVLVSGRTNIESAGLVASSAVNHMPGIERQKY